LLGTNKELEEFTNEEKAAVASTLQLDKGLKGLVDTWEDNYDAMLTSKKGSVEYLNAVTALSKGVGEAFGIEISEDWIAKDNNASLVARLLSGDSSVLAEI
jgi:hypothetical protein